MHGGLATTLAIILLLFSIICFDLNSWVPKTVFLVQYPIMVIVMNDLTLSIHGLDTCMYVL